jgi:A/G-specific adenine glycosylase
MNISKDRAALEDARESLLQWYAKEGRDLPWRRRVDDYAVVVSEFMLQQTRVATVVPYFERWMQRFGDWGALAAASGEEVLSLWQGLGYYRRARNLHQLARIVDSEYQGKLPESLDELRSLPGIGEYTAAAILAFARDQPAAVIDGNVARVLSRIFHLQTPIDTSLGRQKLNEYAMLFQEQESGRRLNSALMELGALLCRAGTPSCKSCPVEAWCTAESPADLPKKAPKIQVTPAVDHRWLTVEKNGIWLHQSEGPRWKGLWLLPEAPPRLLKTACAWESNYSITRYRVTLRVWVSPPRPVALTNCKLHPISALPALPMPAPHRRAVESLLS